MNQSLVLFLIIISLKGISQTNSINNKTFPIKFTREVDESAYDTIVDFNFIKKNLWLYQRFNLPILSHNQTGNSEITITNGAFKYVIESDTADLTNRKLTFSTHDNYNCLEAIDSNTFYGTDCNTPKMEISRFDIIGPNKNSSLPKKDFNDLFEPNIKCNSDLDCYIKGYKTKNNITIIEMFNSDAAGSYLALFFFKNDVLLKRIVGIPF